jgi:hypothetical protein
MIESGERKAVKVKDPRCPENERPNYKPVSFDVYFHAHQYNQSGPPKQLGRSQPARFSIDVALFDGYSPVVVLALDWGMKPGRVNR